MLTLDGEILCPGCGEGYLHIGDASMAIRGAEDGPARRVSVSSDGAVNSRSDADAPGRRNSVRIRAFCEHCDDWGKLGHRTVIELVEHKGFLVMHVTRDAGTRPTASGDALVDAWLARGGEWAL